MFRISKNQAVFGMSYTRSKARSLIDSLSKQVNTHILKYIIYYDVRPDDRNHWLDELSTWFERVNRISSKSNLKRRDYAETLFGWFGDTREDAEINLEFFYDEYVKYASDPYPEFEITSKLVNQVYSAYRNVCNQTLPILTSHQHLATYEWKNIIRHALDIR